MDPQNLEITEGKSELTFTNLNVQPIYFHLSPKETSITPSNLGQI